MLRLPLNRLSARNCGILEIDAAFLQNYRSHLRKLDLSCNHLKSFLSEITRGVAHSNLTVLLLDHINSTPALGQSYCPWVNISVDAYSLLQTIPLMVLSVQANQLGAYSNLNIRKYTPLLKYVDASQNDFNDTSFYVTQVYDGQEIDEPTNTIFHTTQMQPPALRFLALRSLTTPMRCGQVDKSYFDCNADSYLFLEDNNLIGTYLPHGPKFEF